VSDVQGCLMGTIGRVLPDGRCSSVEIQAVPAGSDYATLWLVNDSGRRIRTALCSTTRCWKYGGWQMNSQFRLGSRCASGLQAAQRLGAGCRNGRRRWMLDAVMAG